MKKKGTLLLAFTYCIFFMGTTITQAQETETAAKSTSATSEFKNAINTCPGAVFFGIYSLNYEHLFHPNHGLVGRFDYESIPKTYTDANIESSGVAFILNYRWHISGEMKSVFLGAYARHRIYSGSGTSEATPFDFKLPETTFGLNAGKRWVWKSGFNITLSLGYGFSFENRTATPTNAAIEASLDQFEKAYDFIDPFLGEFSIGYAF